MSNQRLRPRWRAAGIALLVALGGASAGCEENHALLLTVTAESRVDAYDLVVLDLSTREIVFEAIGEPVDVSDPTRDISEAGQELRIALRFERSGRYLVHIVGRSLAAPQYAVRTFEVDGVDEHRLTLVPLPGRDNDGDGFISAFDCEQLGSPSIDCAIVDCDDASPLVHPLAPEICGNGADENCDGIDPPCIDEDGDGVPADLDCDDQDPDRFPGNAELPNTCPTIQFPNGVADPKCDDGIDQDCDGRDVACVIDADCDGVSPPDDCDDTNPDVRPGAPEICGNGVDENCNLVVDEGCVDCDLDGDGFQRDDPANGCPTSDYPAGRPLDCDDLDAGVAPMLTDACNGMEGGELACAALHLCDGIDNDCDGQIDEGCPPANCDADGDGFMNTSVGCNPTPSLTDCNDLDPLTYPGAPDRCGDGILQNCNTETQCTNDADGDGYNASVDCDDNNPDINPGAVEVCNGVDDDCDGMIDEGNPDGNGARMVDMYCNDDADGVCGDPGGAGRCICSKVLPGTTIDAANRSACPDEDLGAQASPRCLFAPQPSPEQCDALDWDCNGQPDDPLGQNLLELGQPCGPNQGVCVPGQVIGCDLSQTTPGANNPNFVCTADFVGPSPEQCNGFDDNCDGALPANEQDGDNDGYMSCTGCTGPLAPGISGCGDCADGNPNRNPGLPEQCNNRDDNCAGGLTDDGADECAAPTPDCCGAASQCVNLNNDANNCGGCGTTCSLPAANRCGGGNCRCGTSAPCGAGQACVGSGTSATCQCTASSCSNGCCNGTSCVFYGGQTNSQCGTGGAACAPCSNGRQCNASGTCICPGGGIENNCSDNFDNDCDGQVDCNDSNCAGDPCGPNGRICSGSNCVCPGGGTENNCGDGVDNDCDGSTDCQDSADCLGMGCGGGRTCDATGDCT